jgi:hypothetical protein
MSAERDLAIARAVLHEMREWVLAEARDCGCTDRIIRNFNNEVSAEAIIAQVDKTHDPKTHDNAPDNNHCMGCWYEATHCQVCGDKYELRCYKCQNF